VAHVSVNNVLFGTGTATPLYDYMPETVSPSSTTGPANYKLGSGVGVAVIDSGIHVNQDLIGTGTKGLILQNLFPNVIYAESFVKGEGIDDYYGHGTHVAGIIAGNGANSNGTNYQFNIHGVAPGAKLISLKVLNRQGQSTDAEVPREADDPGVRRDGVVPVVIGEHLRTRGGAPSEHRERDERSSSRRCAASTHTRLQLRTAARSAEGKVRQMRPSQV